MDTAVILAQPRVPQVARCRDLRRQVPPNRAKYRAAKDRYRAPHLFFRRSPLFRPRSGRASLFFGQTKGEKETYGTVHSGDESVKKNW